MPKEEEKFYCLFCGNELIDAYERSTSSWESFHQCSECGEKFVRSWVDGSDYLPHHVEAFPKPKERFDPNA